MDQSVEKCAGSDDDSIGADGAAVAQADAVAASARRLNARYFLDNQVRNFGLLDLEICLRFQHLAHLQTVGLLVALGTWRPNGGPARSVQQAELDADGIRDFAHDAAERVYFADKMSFGDTANGGVARHLRDEINVEGIKGGLQPYARRGHGGLATGVSCADHYDVELFGELLHKRNANVVLR